MRGEQLSDVLSPSKIVIGANIDVCAVCIVATNINLMRGFCLWCVFCGAFM